MQQIRSLFRKQTQFFQTGHTQSVAYRINALRSLYAAITKYESHIVQALHSDLNKSEFEAYSTEVGFVLREIRFIMKRLRSWTRPQKQRTPLTHLGSKSAIYYEPYGMVLIIAPWNFPFQLSLAPLIGAVAAGNCAIVKPSELAPHTSEIIATVIEEAFSLEHVAAIEGGIETSQMLLHLKFDYIFFTGSERVGKVVMEAAAKQLTPVTLELGGKSPVIIHKDAHLKLAAKRIAWGKFINAGQTCIAPDYIFVHHAVKTHFIQLLKEAIQQLYGPHPLANESYTRIVNEQHFHRLLNYMREGEVVIGGSSDPEKLLIEPTVITKVTPDCQLMNDEIFGPIIPIINYEHVEHAIEYINSHPKPLALYLFTSNKPLQRQVLSQVSFGGGCINDTLFHVTNPYLPFGGVGSSGIGAYHGRSSFELFSHRKSILKQTTLFDLPVRYPHVKHNLKLIKRLLR